MKRITALLVVLMLLSSLFSCGELDDDTTSADIDTSNSESIENPIYPSSDENMSTPLFWKVSGNGYDGNFYLLGSIHVGLDDTNLYPDEITEAWNSCDHLAVESDIIDLENNISAASKALLKLRYGNGTKIKDHIDDDVYSKSVEILTRYEIYNSLLDDYMPVLWTQLIDDCLLLETSFDANNGVDRHFLTDAKENGKDILEIENYLDTYVALASISESAQEFILKQYIDDEYITNYAADIKELYDAWKSGNIDEIIRLFGEDDSIDSLSDEEIKYIEEYNSVMLDDRNPIMIKMAEEYMKKDYDVFYIVGLAHMIGDNGIVEGLRELGYSVELVSYK